LDSHALQVTSDIIFIVEVVSGAKIAAADKTRMLIEVNWMQE